MADFDGLASGPRSGGLQSEYSGQSPRHSCMCLSQYTHTSQARSSALKDYSLLEQTKVSSPHLTEPVSARNDPFLTLEVGFAMDVSSDICIGF
eukprot:scaffold336631_cov34-Prasinocladus_malaysianus.AAC.2